MTGYCSIYTAPLQFILFIYFFIQVTANGDVRLSDFGLSILGNDVLSDVSHLEYFNIPLAGICPLGFGFCVHLVTECYD